MHAGGVVIFLVRMWTYKTSSRMAVMLCVFQAIGCHVGLTVIRRGQRIHIQYLGDIFAKLFAGNPYPGKITALNPKPRALTGEAYKMRLKQSG
jgi:hypothetical protein